MLGMLIIIFRGHRIARASRVARQLDVFFCNMGCGAANLDVGSVGLENPGHRVLATPVIIIVVIIVIVVPVTHPLVVVVLTVSHVSPFYRSKIVLLPNQEFTEAGLSSKPNCHGRSARRGMHGALPPRDARSALDTDARSASESQCSSTPHRFCRTSRSTKTRSPTASASSWLDQIIQPAGTSSGFLA
jgi:hypothetical protein